VCGTGQEKDGTRMFALQPSGEWLPTGRRGMTALYVWENGRLMRNDVGADGKWTTPCVHGDARVDMRVANGEVARVDISVADPAPALPAGARDLGRVDARTAAAFLEDLTNEGNGAAADHAHVAWMMTPGYEHGMSVQTPMVPPAPAASPAPTAPHSLTAPHSPTPPTVMHVVPSPAVVHAPATPAIHGRTPEAVHIPVPTLKHAPPAPHVPSVIHAPASPAAPHSQGAPMSAPTLTAPAAPVSPAVPTSPSSPAARSATSSSPAPAAPMRAPSGLTPPAPMAPPRLVTPATPPTPPSIPRELVPLTDTSLPLEQRVAALQSSTRSRNEIIRAITVYRSIPDRAMRVETIKWLASHENAEVRAHLMRVVRDARVLEEQQAALQALSNSSAAAARAFAKDYNEQHPASRIER
jgi:hypothetical protein